MLATTASVVTREKHIVIAKFEICEKEFDKALEIFIAGKSNVFDSF